MIPSISGSHESLCRSTQVPQITVRHYWHGYVAHEHLSICALEFRWVTSPMGELPETNGSLVTSSVTICSN